MVVEASPNLSTLLDLRQHPHQKAGSGKNGMGKDRHGAYGKDLRLLLPVVQSLKMRRLTKCLPISRSQGSSWYC